MKFYYSFAAEFLMAESIQFVFGGFQCIFMGFYSYISDISTEDNRTVRIAIVDFFYFVGFSMGTGSFSSSLITVKPWLCRPPLFQYSVWIIELLDRLSKEKWLSLT